MQPLAFCKGLFSYGEIMETIRLNEKEFSVIRLLGKGKGGYSYLVSNEAGEYVLKQIHPEP